MLSIMKDNVSIINLPLDDIESINLVAAVYSRDPLSELDFVYTAPSGDKLIVKCCHTDSTKLCWEDFKLEPTD